MIRAGIIGVSGYSGMALARILSTHPGFVLAWATSDRWGGRCLGDCMAIGGALKSQVVVSQAEVDARLSQADVVFLCTPPEISIALAPKVLSAGARIVDLSGGFRLSASDYPRWYGFEHPEPALLQTAIYSLPEATQNGEAVRTARLVSNPGCYPTASALPLVALLRGGVLAPDGIVVDAKSGTTGAGRKATEALSFSEVAEDFRAYRILAHQHTPEIERILVLSGAVSALRPVKVTFTAHLLPVRRGILATIYGRLALTGLDSERASLCAEEALRAFAHGKPFIQVVAPEEVSLARVVGTNHVLMGVRVDAERGVVLAVSAEDNLVKGAAGQAVQNANLMFGLPETMGLDLLAGHAP